MQAPLSYPLSNPQFKLTTLSIYQGELAVVDEEFVFFKDALMAAHDMLVSLVTERMPGTVRLWRGDKLLVTHTSKQYAFDPILKHN